jgi:hypothetical protein
MPRYVGRRRTQRPLVYPPAPPPTEPPRTQLEWDWAICMQGWAVWFRGIVLRALEGSRCHHAAIARRGGRVSPKLFLLLLAIASLAAHHAIAAALAYIPLCPGVSTTYELMHSEV